MYRKHNFEEKLNLVSQVKNCQTIKSVSKKYGIGASILAGWVQKYDLYGEKGLKRGRNIRATGELKETVSRLVLEKSVPLSRVALQYCISDTSIKSWIKIVRSEGYIGLYKDSIRGRPLRIMGRPKKRAPETELEKLQAENVRLRAENALLKKVKALVEEREARERMIGQKPSKN